MSVGDIIDPIFEEHDLNPGHLLGGLMTQGVELIVSGFVIGWYVTGRVFPYLGRNGKR